MDLYPIFFEPIYKEKVWGGRKLERLGRRLPEGRPIGESWDVVDESVARNGSLAGKTLAQLTSELKADLVGERVWDRYGDRFPLLLKFIDASTVVSVQVHPDDAYAQSQGEPQGKTECWYVMQADPGSRLIHGFEKPTGRMALEAAIQKNDLETYLHYTPVNAGDVVFVPAGTVHAIGEGQLMYEIQQKSDTTYRLYDWGRMGLDGKPRDLHVEQSLDALDFTLWPEHVAKPLPVPGEDGRFYLAACRHFTLELWDVCGSMRWETDGESFSLMTVVDGAAALRYGEYGEDLIEVGYGDTVLLPAGLGWCMWETADRCKVLRAYVPDLWMDIVSPLLSAGAHAENVLRIGGYGRENALKPLLPGA